MPSKSEKQRRFFGMVRACQKGELDPKYQSDKVVETSKHISAKDAEDFACCVEGEKKNKKRKKN